MKYDADIIILTKTADDTYFDMTYDCIESIRYSEPDLNINVIVMESEKDSKYIYDNANKVIVPDCDFNYNKFINIGMKECKSEWRVLSNNDVIYHDKWLTTIKSVYATNSHIKSFSPWTEHWHRPRLGPEVPPVKIGYTAALEVAGWCIIARKEVFDTIGPLDEQFEFWYQDNDYAMTLHSHGIMHALVSISRVTHLISPTSINGKSYELLDDKDEKTLGQKGKFDNKWSDYINKLKENNESKIPITKQKVNA